MTRPCLDPSAPRARIVAGMAELKTGDKAPAFTLLDQDGKTVKLSRLQGPQGARVLLPEGRHARAAPTQACGLRDIRRRDRRHRRSSASAPTSRRSRRSSTTSTASASRCSPTPTTPSPRPTACGREKTNYGKKYMGIVRSAFLIDEKGKIAAGLVQDQPEGHADEPARGARRVTTRCPTPIDVLPHRPPFLFVDEVTALVPGQSAPRACGASPATSGSSPATSRAGRRCRAC